MKDPLKDRLNRQKDIVPIEKLNDRIIQVVGVGGIGRQVARQLVTMGVSKLMLVDGDTVEVPNLGVQGFREKDLGKNKAVATAEWLREFNSKAEIQAVPTMFKKSDPHGDIIFCCVDTMEARKMIWNSVVGGFELFIDGRMQGLTMRILSVFDQESADHYAHPRNLFDDGEADEGRCTEKSTIFTADAAAMLMTNTMVRWMRNKWPADEEESKSEPGEDGIVVKSKGGFNMRRFQDQNLGLVTGQWVLYGDNPTTNET